MKCPNCGALLAASTPICPACSRPLLLPLSSRQVALTDSNGRTFPLPQGISRIGRDPASNEIVLMDQSVSSRHAAVEVSPRAIVVRDLGSTNGTQINGDVARQATVLQTGDVVTFGDRAFTVTPVETSHPRAPRGIPIPVRPTSKPVADAPTRNHVSTAIAAIALALLATMLHAVGLADGFQRDALPLPLVMLLPVLVALPLLGVVMIAASRRAGYLVTAVSGLAGLIYVAISGPIFGGGIIRNEITSEYGSTGYWFIVVAAIFALVTGILLLTVSIAGWRVLQPEQTTTAPATSG